MFLLRNKALGDLAWSFLGRGGKAFFMLFLNMWIATAFGVDVYAEFVIIFSIYLPLSFMSSAGLCYYFNRSEIVTSKYFFVLLMSGILGALLFSFAGVLVILWLELSSVSLAILFFWFVSGSFMVILVEALRGRGEIKKTTWIGSIMPAGVSILFLLFANHSLEMVVTCLMMANILSSAVGLYLLRDNLLIASFKHVIVGDVILHIRHALPLLSLNFSTILIPQVLIWFITPFGSSVVSGLGLALRFLFIFSLPAWGINSIAPKRIHSMRTSSQFLFVFLGKSRLYVLSLSVLLYFLFIFTGERFIRLMFDSKFGIAYEISVLFGFIAIAQAYMGPRVSVLNVLGYGNVLLKIQLLCLPLIIMFAIVTLYFNNFWYAIVGYVIYQILLSLTISFKADALIIQIPDPQLTNSK